MKKVLQAAVGISFSILFLPTWLVGVGVLATVIAVSEKPKELSPEEKENG